MAGSDSHSNHRQDPDLLAERETESYRLILRLEREQMECIAALELMPLLPETRLSYPATESAQPTADLPPTDEADPAEDSQAESLPLICGRW